MAARRERDEVRRVSAASGPAGLARQIARAAAGVDSALGAEVWASQLLGTFWRARYALPFPEGVGVDPALQYGQPLLRQLARIDEPGAALATLAIAEVEDGELGLEAKELLDTAGMWRRLPAWAADIGESEIVGAAVMRETVFDDARNVFLESRHADGQRLALGVLIDNNLGGMAKDVLLTDSLELVGETLAANPGEDGAELVLERIEPGRAAGLIAEAISVTDMTWDPPVDDDYWPGRALALLRVDQTPGVARPEEAPEMTMDARDALRDEFLGSPEGSGFAPDGDEAWVATLAIEFAAGYVGSDPLRWSPSVVELFMLDWVPRKVMTTGALLEVLPAALDAWVRFAGRRRGIPASAVSATREAIGLFAAEMEEQASDPDRAGPSKQFLMAAQQAGIDMQDAEALEGFVAGWNARSALDAPGLGTESDGSPREPAEGTEAAVPILQIKVSLTRVAKPPVWRRLQLRADTRLDHLHQIIQIAFGWEDYHLHVFEAGGEDFGPADPDLDLDTADERRFTIADLVAADDRIRYTYDFGDNWGHDILVEKLLEPEPGVRYPVLVTAKGACPPEDCGGVWGYEDLKAVLADPDDEEHRAMREWAGVEESEKFDPAAVDADALRARLAEWQASPR